MRITLIVATLIVAPLAARAQRNTSAPVDTAATRRAVLALEQRIGDANLGCDYAFFRRVEGPEFIFTNARGDVSSRADDLAGEAACRRQKGSYALDDVRVQVHGGVVVFNARATMTIERDSAPASVSRTRFTDVLVWRDSSWVLVAGHSSRLP